jgi:hypothetical protein
MALALGSLRDGRLDLSGKKLTSSSLPSAQIAAASPTLASLDLSCNSLGDGFKLPVLPLLVELRLADNVLGPAAVQRAGPLPEGLRVLDLSSNRLTLLPPCILRLRQLAVLKLDKQRLRELPEEIAMLPQLEELDAGFNELQRALALRRPGLPRLRRLCLRSNGLTSEALSLDATLLPRLTELDLAGNKLATWPSDLGKLEALRSLNLANNRLAVLVSSATMPHRRMWVPSDGVHTLSQLVELSVAQNALTELPASINELRALRRLDVRCNPLSAAAAALAAKHCGQCGTRLLASAMQPAGQGLLLGDESSAWHRPTLLRMHVRSVLSIGAAPTDGVPASRLAAKLPEEYSMVLSDAEAGAAAGAAAVRVTVESLRRAFHAAALRLHPDKQPAEEREKAASAFARLQDAYRALGRAVAMERRKLPELDGLRYAFIELPAAGARSPPLEPSAGNGPDGPDGAADTADTADDDRGAASLAVAFRTQLPAALAFARDARRAAEGALLVHASGGVPASTLALAVLIALLIDAEESPTSVGAAKRALAGSLGREALPPLPPAIEAELEAFAAQSLRDRLHVTRAPGAAVGEAEAPATTDGGAARQRGAAAELSIEDPFGGLTMADPFADDDDGGFGGGGFGGGGGGFGGGGGGFDDGFIGGGFGGGFSFEINGGMIDAAVDVSDQPAPRSTATAAAASVPQSSTHTDGEAAAGRTSELFARGGATLSFGGDDTDELVIGGEHEAGWSVDGEGRDVLHVPGGRVITAVVVEHAEGARRTGGGSFAVG